MKANSLKQRCLALRNVLYCWEFGNTIDNMTVCKNAPVTKLLT